MPQECKNQKQNQSFCTCSYPGCPRHAVCCECIQYHVKKRQLPACCFPPEIEKTYNRSFESFAQAWNLNK